MLMKLNSLGQKEPTEQLQHILHISRNSTGAKKPSNSSITFVSVSL